MCRKQTCSLRFNQCKGNRKILFLFHTQVHRLMTPLTKESNASQVRWTWRRTKLAMTPLR